MKIDDMINALLSLRKKVGGNEEIAVVRTDFGENDYLVPSYPIVGDFEDQDGNTFKCAFVANSGGEEFTERNIPHYEWEPEENKIEYKKEPIRFDGYVRIAEEDLKKFPKPEIVDVSNMLLIVKMHNPYWEDADVDGNEDNPENPMIPGANTKDEYIQWNIDPSSGTILNWRTGTTATCYYKIVDEFEYEYDGFHYEGYVPEFMGIDDDGFGDYVYVTIDEQGKISNWSQTKFMREHKKLVKKEK